MKTFTLAAAAIFLLGISVYAEEMKCDDRYIQAVKRVEGFSTEMSEEAKNKYITAFKRVHQLCEEGKEEEAQAILRDLNKDKDWDTVFSTHDTN